MGKGCKPIDMSIDKKLSYPLELIICSFLTHLD
jgi:hypothetical protein